MTKEIQSTNVYPYNDDFDESKNFHGIVYNPARAVQARELTQSQTQLQNQIRRFADFSFKNGAPVTGAKITFSYKQPLMKINSLDENGNTVNFEALKGLTFKGSISQQDVRIIDYNETDGIVYFSYIGGHINASGENFTSITSPIRRFTSVNGSVATGITSTVTEGVVYVNGYFVYVPNKTIYISNDSTSTDKFSVGFKVDSYFVTPAEDSTLNDNASGTTNFNAPGADRLYVGADLFAFNDTSTETDSNIPEDVFFLNGIIIQSGNLIQDQQHPLDDSEFINTMAKRTYDESGSYTVEPWKINLFNNADDLSTYNVEIKPGSGYIYGYFVDNVYSKTIKNTKARTSLSKDDIDIYNNSGIYTPLSIENNIISGRGVLPFNTYLNVYDKANCEGNVIGTVMALTLYRVHSQDVRLYLADTSGIIGNFASVRSIGTADKLNYVNVFVNENNFALIYGNEGPQVFTGVNKVLKNVVNESIEYNVCKTYYTTSETGNEINIIESSELVDFMPDNTSLINISDDAGTFIDVTNINVVPDNSTSVSTLRLSGSAIVPNTNYNVTVRVNIEKVSPRTKIPNIINKSYTIDAGTNSLELQHEDVFYILSVFQTSNLAEGHTSTTDIKDRLKLNTGQTDYFYELSSITGFESVNDLKANPLNSTSYDISYIYYNHSGIGPFCVNSYTSSYNINSLANIIDDVYTVIPKYVSQSGETYDLKDCYDFRIKTSEIASALYSFPTPRTEIASNIEKYLPRIDAVYVTKSGEFGIKEGIPSENPMPPTAPDGSMIIYYIDNAAYTNDVSALKLNFVDNRRYTMRDIGALDKRITNAENAISLSQLEISSINMKITDASGADRYKTGIFTDNFKNFDNSDYVNEGYTCNIDSTENCIRANFNAENYMFLYNDVYSTNSALNGIIVNLPYTTEVYTRNLSVSGTINVQKLLFYVWNGNLKLTPSVDTWVNDLGQFVISETTIDTPQPPDTFRSWTNRSTSTGSVASTTTTTTTTVRGTWTGTWETVDEVTAYETQDKYLRIRDVRYDLQNVRPGVPLYAFMDNVPLELSDNVPNTDAVLFGSFKIPENMPVGTKNVVFTDSPNINDSSSSASATYTGSGITVWDEIDRFHIRSWIYNETTSRTTSTSRSVDPVAQTFVIEETSGIYVDSIDIYFNKKDESKPVWVYIVPTDNGYPTFNALPFATKILNASEVNISDDASVATNFKFDCPIYLSGETEYAFVVATDSLSYEVFMSTLGEADLVTGVGIALQPHLGSMFISQNASTWTAEQMSDLTFRLHRCKFDTNIVSNTLFDLSIPEQSFEVAMQNIVAGVFIPNNTDVKMYYKWSNEPNFTQFNNSEDVFLSSLNNIIGTNDNVEASSSLQVKFEMSTSDDLITPQLDTEFIYGIFCNNVVTLINDSPIEYEAGTYISNIVKLEDESDDMRIILDAILPNKSEIDVYVKTSVYNPFYVLQSSKGTLGTNTEDAASLDSSLLQTYYYNNDTKELEPKSQVEVSGYSANDRRVYLRQVGVADEFYNNAPVPNNDSLYVGLDSKYTHILLLPIFSSTNIEVDNWNSSDSYFKDTYVFYDSRMWVALVNTAPNTIPSEMSIAWKLIPIIKTSSTLEPGELIEWRHMTCTNPIDSTQAAEDYHEYVYKPTIDIESEFTTFAVKIVMRSWNKVDIPRVKNLRAISTL